MLTRYSIWDLDNCLFDDKWRAKYIDRTLEGNDRYAVYNSHMLADPVHNLHFFKIFEKLSRPVFFTGRSVEFQDLTYKQIANGLGITSPMIYFRGKDEQATPADVKQRMLRQFAQLLVTRCQIIGAFDDLASVVEMYHRYDIPASVLAIHPGDHSIYEPADLAPATTTN